MGFIAVQQLALPPPWFNPQLVLLSVCLSVLGFALVASGLSGFLPPHKNICTSSQTSTAVLPTDLLTNLHPTTKPFYYDGYGLFQDGASTIHSA